MGADFSPATWEVCRQMVEQLATALFADKSLVEKHKKYLDKLQWGKKLGKSTKFVQAHASEVYKGVLTKDGTPENTPHHLFVDDDVYAEILERARILQAIAAGIEAVFIILGDSALDCRQDPIAWDKLFEMVINYTNKILGLIVDTRKMTVSTPPEFVNKVVTLLHTTWHPHRKSFEVKEAETLTGMLVHISNTAPWLKHLLSQLYTSVAYALQLNKSYLVSTSKRFREQLKIAKQKPLDDTTAMETTFALSETARKQHNLRKKHFIPPTMREELALIQSALEADNIPKGSPIAHLIPNVWDSEAHGDSSLEAAGGWSTDMQFWWWLDWPDAVQKRTLRHIKDGKSGDLIDINTLEYATVLINFAASVYFWVIEGNRGKKNRPHPRVLIKADNTSAEAWAMKGCKRSLVGRSLGRIQCSLEMGSPVAITTGHVTTKNNVIADRISRWKKDTNTLLSFEKLSQEFPQLASCRRFHPSNELISWVLDAVLCKKLPNPLELRKRVLMNPGEIAS